MSELSTAADTETTRVVVVVNKNLDAGRAMNTAAHLALGLANLIGEGGRRDLKFLDFVDGNGQLHPSISARSLIVLRGTANEIRTTRLKAVETAIPFVDFTSTMTGDTYVEQLQRTAATPESDLEYAGIALIGLKEMLQPLTKKLSLWK